MPIASARVNRRIFGGDITGSSSEMSELLEVVSSSKLGVMLRGVAGLYCELKVGVALRGFLCVGGVNRTGTVVVMATSNNMKGKNYVVKIVHYVVWVTLV